MSNKDELDKLFRERFKDSESPVSDKVWENIKQSLPPEPGSTGGLVYWLIAGLVLTASITATVYFFNGKKDSMVVSENKYQESHQIGYNISTEKTEFKNTKEKKDYSSQGQLKDGKDILTNEQLSNQSLEDKTLQGKQNRDIKNKGSKDREERSGNLKGSDKNENNSDQDRLNLTQDKTQRTNKQTKEFKIASDNNADINNSKSEKHIKDNNKTASRESLNRPDKNKAESSNDKIESQNKREGKDNSNAKSSEDFAVEKNKEKNNKALNNKIENSDLVESDSEKHKVEILNAKNGMQDKSEVSLDKNAESTNVEDNKVEKNNEKNIGIITEETSPNELVSSKDENIKIENVKNGESKTSLNNNYDEDPEVLSSNAENNETEKNKLEGNNLDRGKKENKTEISKVANKNVVESEKGDNDKIVNNSLSEYYSNLDSIRIDSSSIKNENENQNTINQLAEAKKDSLKMVQKVDSLADASQNKKEKKDSKHIMLPLSIDFFVAPGFNYRRLAGDNDIVNNKNEHEQIRFSTNTGVRFNYSFSEQLYLSLGMQVNKYGEQYNYIKEETHSTYSSKWVKMYPNSTDSFLVKDSSYYHSVKTIRKNNYYRYLSVPIYVTYAFGKGRVGISMSAAFSTNFLLGAFSYRLSDSIQVVTESSNGPNNPFRKTTNSIMIMPGMTFRLNDRWKFILEPCFNLMLSSVYKKDHLFKEMPYSFRMQAGLRYNFK